MSLPDEALKAFDAAVTEVGVRNILLVDRLRGAMARALVAPQPSANTAPADPMDWPLPCDVKVGHGTMRKGVALRTLVARMKVLYEMATGEDADRVANRTPEKRAALIADFQRAIAAAQPATAPADHAPAGAEAEAATDAALGLVTLPPIRVDRATHAALQESAKARGVVLQAIVRERLAPYLMPLQPATAPVVPALPEPYATSVTWRNAEGGSWQQWHDAEDPMPAEWDGRPPDEVVHVYTEAQVRAMLAAAPAAPVVPQPAAQQGEADRDAEAELICAEDVLDGYAAGLDLKQTHFDCVGDYIKAVVERLRHSVDFYQRRCDLLQQWQSRMRDPERTIVCDILANAQMLPDPTGARYGAQQGEAVAPIIVRALELAMAICDRVPTRWHEVGDAHPIERDIGRMVNVQPDGSHGYRLIADALSAAKAAPPARQAVALTDEDVERLFTDPRGQTYVMAEQYDEFCAFKARTRTIERAVWQANGITPAGGEAAR